VTNSNHKAVAIVTRETQPLFSDCNCNALTDIHGLCRQKLYTTGVVIYLERGADFYYLPQHARAARMHFALSHCRSSDEVLILDDDDDNPSDHYAITCKIVASGIVTDINVNTSKQSKLQWDKGVFGLYSRDLSQYLSTVRLPTEALHCQGHCSLNHRE